MRRPRGPGGRFLTAEEIAAQKSAQVDGIDPNLSPSNEGDHDHESAETHGPVQSPPAPFDENQSLAQEQYQHDTGSLGSPTQPQSQQAQYGAKSPTGSNPIPLHSPYSGIQQMHSGTQSHLPYSNGLFPDVDGVASSDDTEMRRRTEEMIQFGARGGAPAS